MTASISSNCPLTNSEMLTAQLLSRAYCLTLMWILKTYWIRSLEARTCLPAGSTRGSPQTQSLLRGRTGSPLGQSYRDHSPASEARATVSQLLCTWHFRKTGKNVLSRVQGEGIQDGQIQGPCTRLHHKEPQQKGRTTFPEGKT